MAVDNKWILTKTFKAAEDLNSAGHEGIIVTIADNKVANNGQEATGVLVSKPKNGEHGTIVMMGLVKARAGGAIANNGVFSTTTSGYLKASASGDYINGRAMEAITSGSLGLVFWHGTNQYQVSSLDG